MQPPHPPYLFNVLLSHIHSNIGNSLKFGEILVSGKIAPNLKNSPKFGEILLHKNEFSSLDQVSVMCMNIKVFKSIILIPGLVHELLQHIVIALSMPKTRLKNGHFSKFGGIPQFQNLQFLQIWGNPLNLGVP